MSPTYHNGDVVFVQKFNAEVKNGDVIVFEENKTKEKLIKRVVTSQKAEIYVDNFQVFVDGLPYEELPNAPPYWDKNAFECRFSDFLHNDVDHYFVMGDNRCNSLDSRFLGAVSKKNLVGKVLFKLFSTRPAH